MCSDSWCSLLRHLGRVANAENHAQGIMPPSGADFNYGMKNEHQQRRARARAPGGGRAYQKGHMGRFAGGERNAKRSGLPPCTGQTGVGAASRGADREGNPCDDTMPVARGATLARSETSRERAGLHDLRVTSPVERIARGARRQHATTEKERNDHDSGRP